MTHLSYDAVIFDLDGTLTDSSDGIMRSVAYAVEKMGKPPLDAAVMLKFMGPPLADSFSRYCGMSVSECEKATMYYRERYVPIGWKENKVFPGIRNLLYTLRMQGAYLAIATGKPLSSTMKILQHYDLARYFTRVIGPDDQNLHADKAELIRAVLPRDIHAVMVGDRDMDIIGAQTVGIDSIAAGYGYGSREELLSSSPTLFAADVGELTTILVGTPMTAPGFFISLEGLDGCGKSTQAAMLEASLADCGFDVLRTREPGGCPLSESIRDILLDARNQMMCPETEALLYAAARAQHVREVIAPAIRAGRVVLCDRFVDSSIAYQGGGRELGAALVERVNEPAVRGFLPSATVLLSISHGSSLKRRCKASSPDRIEREDGAFYQRVEDTYKDLAVKNAPRYIVVDADMQPDQIAEVIRAELLYRMREAGVA
jgi:dTMP kinase